MQFPVARLRRPSQGHQSIRRHLPLPRQHRDLGHVLQPLADYLTTLQVLPLHPGPGNPLPHEPPRRSRGTSAPAVVANGVAHAAWRCRKWWD